MRLRAQPLEERPVPADDVVRVEAVEARRLCPSDERRVAEDAHAVERRERLRPRARRISVGVVDVEVRESSFVAEALDVLGRASRRSSAIRLDVDRDLEPLPRRGLLDEQQPLVLRRVEAPPRDDDRPDAGARDLTHLRGDDLRVRRRVQAAAREVLRREDRRAVSIDVPVRPTPVLRRCGVPRVVEDRDALGSDPIVGAGRRERNAGGDDHRSNEHSVFAVWSTPRGTLPPGPDRGGYDRWRMGAYRYLIVGGGMTADAACRGIRDHDADGSIGMFAAESHDPYARPPLSKALWSGKEEASIFRGTPELGVDVHTGRRIICGRPRCPHGERRHGRVALLREGPPRDRRHAAAPAVGRRRRHLLPDARRLPTPARARWRRRARQRSSAEASSAPRSRPRSPRTAAR